MSTSKTPFITTPNFFCTFSNPTLPSRHFLINTPPKFHKKPLPKLFIRTISSQIQNPSIRHGRRRRNSLRDKLLKENRQVSESPQLSESGKTGDSPLRDKLESWVDRYKEDSELWGLGTRPIFTIYEDSNRNVVRVSVDEDEIARRARVRAWSFEERDAAAGDEEFEDVQSKISRARLVAKRIEEGTFLIPRNSSVAKFVVEKEEEGVASLGHEAVSKGFPQIGFGAVSKAVPLIGLAALCGACVFWIAARMFAREEKVELKREEVEMLRRKKEFMMKKERFEKGNLKVLPEVEALPAAHIVRPQLDRNEMMRSIEQARMTREGLGHSSVNDSDFDAKVMEIREMARKARETEQRDQSRNDRQGEDVDLRSVLLPISDRDGKNLELLKDLQDMKLVGENRKDYVDVITDGKPSDIVGANSDMVSSEAVDPVVNHGENVERAMYDTEHVLNIEDGKMVGKTNEDYVKNIVDGESLKSSGANTGIATITVVDSIAAHGKNTQHSADIESRILVREDGKDCRDISSKLLGDNRDMVASNGNDHKKDAVGFLGKMPIEVDGENYVDKSISSTVNTNAFSNKAGENKTKKINLRKASNNIMSHASGFGSKNKPKIIKSVRQAREYLAEKNGTSTHEKSQSRQGKQLKKRHAVDTNARPRPYDDKPVDRVISKAGNEKFQVVDSTCGDIGSLNSRKDSQVDYVSGTKLHEDDTNNNGKESVIQEGKVELSHDIPIGKSEKTLDINVVMHTSAVDDSETDNVVHLSKSLHCGDTENTDSRCYKQNDSRGEQRNTELRTWRDRYSLHASGNKQVLENQGISYDDLSNGSSVKDRTGTKENGDSCSQEFDDLSNKEHLDSKAQLRKSEKDTGDCNISEDWTVLPDRKMVESADVILSAANSSEKSISRDDGLTIDASTLPADTDLSRDLELPLDVAQDSDVKHDTEDLLRSKTSFRRNSDGSDCQTEPSSLRAEKSWVEENFQQLDPIIKKIGDGFRANYMVAKEKAKEQSSLGSNISEIRSLVEEEELEWMKDEKLSEIVFKVRDNELAGRDPFHMMDADDQHAFFKGLERKAEKINEKLLGVHEYLHSRIDNIDYGADGISLHDPLEKIVPRWKSPAIAKDPEFLNEHTANKKVNFDGDVRSNLQKSGGLPNSICTPPSLVNGRISNGTPKSSKTVIECSDGSSRPGKKTGKEHWQHTKKWSQGFLDVYNAETDPEIKSIMKDMGKDLDRWATEKDIEDTADLMTKLPKKKRRYIEKKMDKLKREMEMYGPQAVVSKYREYSDEKEEDYLWWLDLQFVLCIELYTIEDDVAEVGFYSLEMAAELELDPKQHHVIAFEDPGDCKSFCYIIQAQMDLLGNGRAFVVARPPKDAFREAKANGFNVTVIKKGEVRLNVDQTLDEVEVKLVEIGSKIYHDKLMHERGVDIRTLTKGVISADNGTKKKPKKMVEGTGKSKRL